MKDLDRSKVEEPKVLEEKGKELSDANKEAFLKNPQDYIAHVKAPQSRHGKNTFDIKPEVYGCQEVKEALDRIQNGMCCYCECYYETSGKGEVEHFRWAISKTKTICFIALDIFGLAMSGTI